MTEEKHLVPHLKRPPKYTVAWSEEDQEYVATVEGEPYLSWLEKDPARALRGLVNLLRADMGRRALFPGQAAPVDLSKLSPAVQAKLSEMFGKGRPGPPAETP